MNPITAPNHARQKADFLGLADFSSHSARLSVFRPVGDVRLRLESILQVTDSEDLMTQAGVRRPGSLVAIALHNQPLHRPMRALNFLPATSSERRSAEEPDAGAYDEETFRYFLAIERERSQRSNRPFLLMLVDLARGKEHKDVDALIEGPLAETVFDALSQSLRETDFVGWYRSARVAGAVLTQVPGAPGSDVSSVVVERVKRALHQGLPADVRSRLQVRVYETPTSQTVRS